MAFYTDPVLETPRRRRGNGWIVWIVIAVIAAVIGVIGMFPSNYVIERPGPVYNTLGEVYIDGESVPMIQIPSQKTYPTEGQLDLLTVSLLGNPDNRRSLFEVALASLDPSKTVLPLEEVYPPGYTVEQSNEQGRVDMANSKNEAIAAALLSLDFEVPSRLRIVEVQPDSASEGVLEPDDMIVTLNGETFADVSSMREEIGRNGTEQPVTIVVERAGETLELELLPKLSEDGAPIIGVIIQGEYEFPFAVDIQLQNVGGPSAGMMFALGIVDKLTEGSLTGGAHVAGTGTITSSGEVGPIGGIQQKMYGARDAGARYFFAPSTNCGEVVGNIPEGLTVISVETLDDALTALSTIRSQGNLEALPTCSAG